MLDKLKSLSTAGKMQFSSIVGLVLFGMFMYFFPVSPMVFSTIAGPLVLVMACSFLIGDKR